MFNVNRPSSVTDSCAWLTAAAVGMVVVSGAATSSNAGTSYKRVLNKGAEVSPWAGVSRTTADTYLPTSQSVSIENWHFELSDRMADLAVKQDGWKGPESIAALPMALEYANYLLRKLAVEGIDRRPTVGLDYEGTFSFTWSENEFRADLTVYDDGTYSFFASDGTNSATADEALISDRLPAQLLGLLLS